MSALEINRQDFDIIEVAARRGRAGALIAALALPGPGRAATTPWGEALSIAPDSWLVLAAPGGFAALPSRDDAIVVDQSAGYRIFMVVGTDARAMLAKGCRVDLHPRVFPIGAVARTVIAQIPAIVHRLAEDGYRLLAPSSLAHSFDQFLRHAGAEFREHA